MQPEHRIDELIVDLSFTTTRLARHEKALLSDWLSEDLLPALDQLFSRYSPGQQVLRFETLEFDFGNLTNRNYQQSIREQLLQKFAQLLQTQLLAVVPTHLRLPEHVPGGDNPHARVALTQLFNYLASGQLSAHQPFEQPSRPAGRELTSATGVNHSVVDSGIAKDSDITDNADNNGSANDLVTGSRQIKKMSKPIVKQTALHEQLLDAVIAQHNIAELLRELPQRDLLVQRLLTQFSVPQRLELLRQLAPQQVHNAIALLDLLQIFENNAINADAYRLDSKLVWQVLLQLSLEYPQATTEFWLSRIFRILSANAAIDTNLLQQHLVAIRIPFSSAATPLINLQTQIAQQHNPGQSTLEQFNPKLSNPEQPDSGQFNPEQSNPEQLRQLIAAAFIRADANRLQQLWPQLIASEATLLLAALEHYLPQAEIRQQLMLRLPLALQADIMALLAPALKEVFLQLQTKAGQLIELLQVQTTISPEIERTAVTSNAVDLTDQSPELLLRQLWEIALGLIFKNQSAAATADYSTDSDLLVRTLAARYADLHNLDPHIVQQAFGLLINKPQVNQPQKDQHTRINPVNPHEHSIESYGNTTASNEQQHIKLETELSFGTATTVKAKLENSSQKNVGLENNNYQINSQDTHNYKDIGYEHDNHKNSSYENSSYENTYPEISSQRAESSGVNSLSSISDHQLFDLCLRLKSGALAWSSLVNDIPLLQRLISSYIRLGHSATAENCADFVAAIDGQAESSSAPSAYYLAVLQALIADKLIDLEAIALGIQRSDKSSPLESKTKIETGKEIEMMDDAAVQVSALRNAEARAANTDPVVSGAKQLQLDALAVQLQQGKIKPESLNLTVDQVSQLVDIFITTEKTIAPDIQADLIAAIHQQALHANHKADYYQRVLSMLVRKEMLDLMQVCEQVNQQAIAQPITPVVAASNNIEAIARALLAESAPERQLQALQLDLAQWQSLVAELIQKPQSIDKNSSAELIEAIQHQARQVAHPAHYYRLVIAAVLAREPIDPETLKATANQQLGAFTNQQKVLEADAGLPLGKVQSAGEYEAERTGYESTTTEPDSHPSIGQEIVPQFSSRPIVTAGNITSIVQTLLAESAPELRLQALQLDLGQWQNLVAELMQQVQFVDKDSGTELIDAVQRQSRQVVHSAQYYRLVIAAVLAREPIDLEAFTRAANSPTELMPAQLPANPQNSIQQVSSSITSTTNTKVIARALLTEPQSWMRLQELQLDNRQWETLAAELIQQSQFTDQHSAAELIKAIQTQARVAITPAVYYRLVIQAVLQQHPIDLEVFAATAIDGKQDSSIHGELNNITRDTDSATAADNSIYQHTHQPDAGLFAVEELNAEQFNTAAFNAAQIDTPQIQIDIPQINAAQFSSGNISQNDIHPNHVNPDQAMDYPLLTGSDNSLRKPALSLAQLLAAELPLNQEQLLALQQHINTLLNRSNQVLITEWRELLAAVQHTQVLIHSVPAHLLHQIAMRLQASRYTWLDALVKLVMEALALLVADINNLAIKQAKWEFVFNYLFAADNTNNNTTETSARALELSIELCEQLASAAGIEDVQRLVNLTQRRIALLKPPAQQKPTMRLQDITTNPATHSDATTPQWEAGLHINNAGQVLAAAFLPRLFSMLNLMQDGKFIHLGAADRAVHLVQFMVTGQSATPEYDLILNKILCGIGTSIPVSAGIEITEQEQTLIEQMLNSMIQHWKVLGSTSVTGLRETFFQRQGWLVLEEDCWRLKVKEQTFDLLLDRLPWSISLIKHGWMDKPVRVSWRNHS